MESLAPPLLLSEFVVSTLENGGSVRSGIKSYLQNSTEDDFTRHVGRWIFSIEHGLDRSNLIQSIQSPHRRAVLTILELGLQGQPIHERLQELNSDLIRACNEEIDSFLSLLPLKMMMPLLIFMFPAFLILLLGPILKTFLAQF